MKHGGLVSALVSGSSAVSGLNPGLGTVLCS